MTIRAGVLMAIGVVALAAAPAAAVDFNLVVGADFGGEFDLGAVTSDAENGYSLGAEAVFDLTSALELGGGLEYGFERGVEGCA